MFPDDVAELFDAYYPDAADRQQFSQDLARLGAEEVARDYEVTLGFLRATWSRPKSSARLGIWSSLTHGRGPGGLT